jgi:spore coat polysaccharide biosynthesis predicted glycosyltransferase SpsG/CMP-N-acetylneuraminic acid synthetase
MSTEKKAENVWILIPARGGSVGVPRKNVRLVAGKPLIAHTILTALTVVPSERVVVVTDDDEIAEVATFFGAAVVHESTPTPGSETLDTKVVRNLDRFVELGALDSDFLLTMQPTSPLLEPERILQARTLLENGAASVITVAPDQHLRWTINSHGAATPQFEKRVNRQELPLEFRESGGIIGARIGDIRGRKTRVIEPVGLLTLSDVEAIDIDNYVDLLAAEHWLTRIQVLIRCDAAPNLGLGHVYRSIAIAYALSHHNLTIVTSTGMPLGREVLDKTPFNKVEVSSAEEFIALVEQKQPELVILDLLDTEAEFIERIRASNPDARIVTFEDSGTGAGVADLLVSELLPVPNVHKQLNGIQNAILAPSFESIPREKDFNATVSTVLVLFGGTDPGMLAVRALDTLQSIDYKGKVIVVRGIGARPLDTEKYSLNISVKQHVTNMARLMAEADIAFTSAGRTVVELACMGVPAICLAQNSKEMTHTHATQEHGIVMLGLSREVEDADLRDATVRLLNDTAFRRRLQEGALESTRSRSNARVINKILERVGLHYAVI